MHPLLAIPISIAILLVATAFGRRIIGLLRIDAGSPIEESVFGMGLGLGALAYFTLVVGLLGFLYWYVILALIIIMCLASLPWIRLTVYEMSAYICENAKLHMRVSDSLITFSAVALGALALISALAPPSGMEWDSLAYHLAVPKLYLNHHSVYYVLFTSHSNFPFLTEMLYTVGLAFGSVGTAKLFHYAMYILTALAILSLGRRHFSPVTGKVGALIFMSAPVVFYEAGIAYADISTAFYVIAAVYAFLNWEQTRSSRWLVLCGMMGGFALGTKVLAAIPIIGICLLVLAYSVSVREWGKGFKLALLTGCAALAVGSVWYIKSYIYTGNPVYPFMYEIFGGRNWSQAAADAYKIEQSSFGMGKTFPDLLMLPWNLLAHGTEFTNRQAANVFALIGPAFLGLLPITVFIGKLRKPIISVSFLSVLSVGAWFILMQHSRYLIPIIPLLSVLAAEGVSAANENLRIGRHAANSFVAFCIILCLIPGFILGQTVLGAVTGQMPPDEYLSKTLDVYDAEKYINDNLPQNAKIVLFDEVRGFYLDREYIWGNPNHHELIPWNQLTTGENMVDWFREHDFTHVLINWKFAGREDTLHGKLIPEAVSRGMMHDVYASKGVSIYALDE